MIRKFNYTGRKKLTKDRIDIKLNYVGGVRTFDANLDFNNLRIPNDAKIYIEPFYKTSFMRFCFGTVGHPISPSKRDLTSLPASEFIQFRIKIVDESGTFGRILAYADDISPSNLKNVPANKTGILHVNFEADNMGPEIWRLNVGESWPILEINKNVELRKELVRSEIFLTLIYPSVIRAICMKLGYVYENYNDGGSDWQSQWILFIKNVLLVGEGSGYDDNLDDEVNDERVATWAAIVTESFCRKFQTLERLNNNLEKYLQ